MADASQNNISASIVLNVMGLRELAVYGFRSWMLQDSDRPYEVILNLFTKARDMFDPLVEGKNPNCIVQIQEREEPEFFNISAANNLGLHLSIGAHVMFANSDIIYPAHFLRRAMAELTGRDICYALAARMNMTAAQCEKLKPPMHYTRANPFTDLHGLECATDANVWSSISPWMLRRDIAFAVGGFDKQVLIAEDRDLTDRAMHYLRRKNLQQAVITFSDLVGYHQNHGNTGLFDSWTQSKAVFEPRKQRMNADPASTEDVLPTPLDDYDALLRDIRQTRKPPLMNQYRQDFKGKITRRAKKVWNALAYGK